MSAKRSRIISEFSLWVAMSAARQGSPVRGRKLYPFLLSVDLAPVLDQGHAWTPEEFQRWHEDQVTGLASAAGIQIGWGAKLIAMLLKTRVYLGGEGHPSLASLIHPPIDTALIREILRRYPRGDPKNARIAGLCKGGFPISKIVTYDQYREVIRGLREVAARENCTLFETESLWSAREAEGADSA
jgi:hypothetical protein